MNRITIGPGERILVISPHYDDETIGCGGLLAEYGPQCDVLFVTDSGKGHSEAEPMSDEECAAIRSREAKRALQLAKVNDVMELKLPEGGVLSAYREKSISASVLGRYRHIFLPNALESHTDHIAVNRLFCSEIKKKAPGANVYEYEVWNPLVRPNCFLDVTESMETVLNMIGSYSSQLKLFDYTAIVEGMRKYRGGINHVPFAEVYELRRGMRRSLRNGLVKAVFPITILKLFRIVR